MKYEGKVIEVTEVKHSVDARQQPDGTHIPVLDHLRGFAALSVCLFHFSAGNRDFLPTTDLIRSIGSFGWLGVEAFFVISGFVIPYSLHLRSYQLKDLGGFFVRRLKRLEPPYFACILLVLCLNYASSLTPGFKGLSIGISTAQLFSHFAYLNVIFGFGWINPVFWTLAIEFQYYILMAFAFPFLNSSNLTVRLIGVTLITCLGFVGGGNDALLPHWLPLFAMGIATFQVCVGHLKIGSFYFLLLLISVISYLVIGIPQTIAGLLTAMAIFLMGKRRVPNAFKPLALIGTISYSLYLLHVPIGGRVINLSTRMPASLAIRYPAIGLAFVVSIVSAYLFWRVVERPSQLWAKTRTPTPAQPNRLQRPDGIQHIATDRQAFEETPHSMS